MQQPSLRKTALAQAIALALGTAALTPVHAQDANDENSTEERFAEDDVIIEEVVVTGYRSSLMRAMDRKQGATGVVDAITAEDFGKFPDQNLAEALQRITGVSIDRANNEGSRITVRGMGPEFNLVTLNGRTMPTAGGRSFDFADIASEGVQAVEVYKTAKASLPSGGIGATVNILTARPLDNPGFRSSVIGRAVHETSASDSTVADLDEFTPEVAALISNTFADDKFGVAITASYQERQNREENASVDNWGPNLQLNGGIVNDNNQRADGTWWHPQNFGVGVAENKRERINGQAVFQYAPTDRITATLDYTYSEVDFDGDANSVGIWFECDNIEATVNERGTVTQVTQSCGDFSTNIARTATIKENNSLGLNVDWQVNDQFIVEFDWHDSSSDIRGGGIAGEPGSTANLIIGNAWDGGWADFVGAAAVPPYPEPLSSAARIDLQTATYGASGIPGFEVSFVDQGLNEGVPQDSLTANDIGSLFGQAFNNETYNDIMQVQLDGIWENLDDGALRAISFGVEHQEQEFDTRTAYSGLLGGGFWLVSNAWWPDEIFEERSIDGLLSGFSGASFGETNYFAVPFETAVNTFETIGEGDFAGFAYWPSDNGGWCGPNFFSQLTADECTSDDGTRGRFWSGPVGRAGSALVDEKINAFYTEFDFETEFNGYPVNAVAGLRYEKTEMTSYGFEQFPDAIVWASGNEFSYDFSETLTPVRGENSTDFWLPSFDMDVEVRDDMIARFSYSRSLARPPIGALSPVRTFVGNPNVRNRVATSGNPELLPYVSDNFDLSLEWYYGEASYAAIGYFRKRVDNFLVTDVTFRTFEGLTDPYLSDEAQQARAELAEEGINPTDQAVFRRINENRGVPENTPIPGEPGDPLAEYRVSQADNLETGNLWGWELAVQHMFGDTGFGVQANLTLVYGDVDADRDRVNQSFALPGLSDSGNLQVFYEDENFSARVAWNWRDEFLSGFDQFGAPAYTEDYAPLDFNVTWYATDNLSVFVEGLNINNEVQRVYSRYPEQFTRGNEYGARYNIGARYNFE